MRWSGRGAGGWPSPPPNGAASTRRHPDAQRRAGGQFLAKRPNGADPPGGNGFQAIAGARISQEAAGRLARSVLKFTHVVMTPHCALISPGKETCRDLLPASNKRFHLRPQPGHNSAVEEKHAPFGGSACPF